MPIFITIFGTLGIVFSLIIPVVIAVIVADSMNYQKFYRATHSRKYKGHIPLLIYCPECGRTKEIDCFQYKGRFEGKWVVSVSNPRKTEYLCHCGADFTVQLDQ